MRLLSFAVLLCFSVAASAAPPQQHWVATWVASASPQMATEAEQAKAHLIFENQTVREIVHLSVGGNSVRVRLSNEFGPDPIQIGSVHAAICDVDGHIKPDSDRALTFSGKTSFMIPANAPYLSDPIQLTAPDLSNICVSLFLPNKTAAAGIHYDAKQTTFIAPGDRTTAEKMPDDAVTASSWMFLAGVDVLARERVGTIVAFGDSITDGAHSTPNENKRWPNILADRLNSTHKQMAVIDAGIGGNRILHDASGGRVAFGVNALARFERDALGEPGARYVIVLEGINDLGHAGTSAPASEAVTAEDLIAGLTQMIQRAHEHGIKIFGATLTPFEGAGYYSPEKEKERERLNEWIRSSGTFDGVVDFEKAVQDPANPTRMLPAYDSGDHLHPGDAGYKAMADAIDLKLFQ